MHYWNKASFEGLIQLANFLEEDPHLSLLADYCRLREKGLRRQAFAALDAFLTVAAAWKPQTSRSACQALLELHARTPDARQFLAQPLLARFVFPVLEAWLREEPTDQVPHRWLGILRRDRVHLERALELVPGDAVVRRCLAEWILSAVEYATHHLSEGLLLADFDATRRSLAEARGTVEAAPDPDSLANILAQIDDYDALLRDWESFSAAPEGTFPEWCARRGRAHRWPTIIYYDK